jgi:AcrR family transcriptional regulator
MTAAANASKKELTRDALLIAVQEVLLDTGRAGLSVPLIVSRAKVSQGTFYNYFTSLDDALDAVAALLLAEHVRVLELVCADVEDVADLFTRSSRQTLQMFLHNNEYGRVFFDSGLPLDRLIMGQREHMGQGILLGLNTGVFSMRDVEIATRVVAGGMAAAMVDLHRGRMNEESIGPFVAELLSVLGVDQARAAELCQREQPYVPVAPVPLSSRPIPSPVEGS